MSLKADVTGLHPEDEGLPRASGGGR